jgi:UPF0755 protein
VPRADVRGNPYRPRRTGAGSAWKGVLVVAVLAAVVIGGAVLVGGPLFRDFALGMARDNPQSIGWPFVSDVVRDDLGDRLEEPAGTDPTPVEFLIPEGATVSRIGRDLVDEGLLNDALVFQYLVITQDVESELQTGTFTLSATMTPQAIVDRLQQPPDPPPAKVTLALRNALRIEQITALLLTLDLETDIAEFYEMATEPPDWVGEDYPWTEVIPEGRSLEGFMGAGVFSIDRDISAEALLRLLLDDWERTFESYITQAEDAEKDFYEVMILASIVEREAALDEERPLVAGVYQSRLDGKAPDGVRLLNADPTVIYAADTMALRDLPLEEWPEYLFWGLEGIESMAAFEVSEDLQGYQSYQVPGLPPGPIASPALESIEAALDPDTESGNLFFVACGDGAHRFAETKREHDRNVQECLR